MMGRKVASHLDNLPTLKAYKITGPVQFSTTPIVWVQVQFTRDNVESLQQEFHTFLSREKIYAVRTSLSGGGQYSGLFEVENAEKIQAWLLERGGIKSEE